MKKNNTKPIGKPVRLPLSAYLAYLLVCTLLLTGVSFSRYLTTTGGTAAARVASGVVEVEYDPDSAHIFMERPWDDGIQTEEFVFTVSNQASEVAIQYDLEITLNKALPNGVTVELDGTTCIQNYATSYTATGAGIFTAGGSEQTNTHCLTFVGDYSTIKSGTDESRKITIRVHATQID